MKKVFTLLFVFALALGVTASYAASSHVAPQKAHPVSNDNGQTKDCDDTTNQQNCANSKPEKNDGCENTDAAHATCCDKDDTDGDSGCCPDKEPSGQQANTNCFCPEGSHKVQNHCEPNKKPKNCADDEVLKNGNCVPKPTPKSGPPGCEAKAVTDPTAPPKSNNCAFVFGTVWFQTAATLPAGETCPPAAINNGFQTASANCIGEEHVTVHLFNKINAPLNPVPAPDPVNTKGKKERVASPATSVALEVATDAKGHYGFLVPAGVTYYVCETILPGEIQGSPTTTASTGTPGGPGDSRVGAKGKSHGEAFADSRPATATPQGDTTCRDVQAASENGGKMRDDEHNNGWYVTPAIGDPLYSIDFANTGSCGGTSRENGAVSGVLIHRQGGVETSVLAPLDAVIHPVNCAVVVGILNL